MIGKTISHYRILQKLGEGGMGAVYKAEDTKLHRSVALKFLLPEMTRDVEAKDRFIHEARTVSSLDHPNIAVVHDIDETDDGQSYICMAYYEGKTLKDVLEDGPMAPVDAIRVVLQIAHGLQRAHEAGIVHRDIKPANIIVTPRGEVKIVDFGIAKLSAEPGTTRYGATAGTAAYMSPEQAQGFHADHRTDLFSLGVVLYEMVTGVRPFTGEHEPALLYSIVNVKPMPPTAVRSGIPASLEETILQLLQKDPNQRFQSAHELAQRLQTLLDTRELPKSEPSRRPLILSRAFWAATLITTVLLILVFLQPGWPAIVEWFSGWGRPEGEVVAILPFENIGNNESLQAYCDGLPAALSSRLSQISRARRDIAVVPSQELRRSGNLGVSESHERFGASIIVTGSIQQMDGGSLRAILNRVDPESNTQVDSRIIEISAGGPLSLDERMFRELLALLELSSQEDGSPRPEREPERDDDAFLMYLRGRGHLVYYRDLDAVNLAIQMFEGAIDHDSLYAEAYAALGEAYWRKFQIVRDTSWISRAENQSARATRLDPKEPSAWISLGVIHHERSRYEEATKDFQKAVELNPRNHDALIRLARSLQAVDRNSEAEMYYKQAVRVLPQYWRGYSFLGSFYYGQGRFDDAVAQFREVIRVAPDLAIGYSSLGGIFVALHRFEEARRVLERGLEVRRDDRILNNLATAYYYIGEYNAALRIQEQAIERDSLDYRLWMNAAECAYWIDEKREQALLYYQQAARLAEKARSVSPRDVMATASLANCYSMLGDSVKSVYLLDIASTLTSHSGETRKLMAASYETLGMRAKALTWVAEAIRDTTEVTLIERDPKFRALKDDVQFQELVTTMRGQRVRD